VANFPKIELPELILVLKILSGLELSVDLVSAKQIFEEVNPTTICGINRFKSFFPATMFLALIFFSNSLYSGKSLNSY
jgi:hypothetical protein